MMDGHEVTVVDNFFTGRKKNVEHWIGHPNFELIHSDIVHPLFIEGNVKVLKVSARLAFFSLYEPPHEKTNNPHMRKQRCRSAWQ